MKISKWNSKKIKIRRNICNKDHKKKEIELFCNNTFITKAKIFDGAKTKVAESTY